MSSGYDQSHKRRLKIRKFKIISTDMPLNVMYRHQRLTCSKSIALRSSHSYQQRADKTRTIRDAEKVNIVHRHACLFQSMICHVIDILKMMP